MWIIKHILSIILLSWMLNADSGFVNPITQNYVEIKSGSINSPMNIWDPFILKNNEGTHLFFGTLFCKEDDGQYSIFYNQNKCKISNDNLLFAIGYGHREINSSQFIFRRTPVFYPSPNPMKWDSNYVETPSLVQKGNRYYLFYSGWKKSAWKRYQIGVAEIKLASLSLLLDQNNLFKRISPAPLIPAIHKGTSFDRENTQEPSAIWNTKKTRFEVYYLGLRAVDKKTGLPLAPDAPLNELADIKEIGMGRKCFSSSFNLINCSKNEVNPQLTTKFDDLSNADFVNMPEVIVKNGVYNLIYTDFSSTKPTIPGFTYGYQKINFRTSGDGISWSKPILLYENNINSIIGIHSPTVFIDTTGIQLAAQGWWYENVSSPTECFLNNFSLPHSNDICKNTSLLIFY